MYERVKWLALIAGCLFLLPGVLLGEENDPLYATRILDAHVIDSAGEQIGQVDDLVIRRNGKIRYATLEIGGWVLGIGGKVVAYSFNELEFEQERVTVQATQETLEQREEFDYFARGLPRSYYYGQYPYPRTRYGFRPHPHGTPGYMHYGRRFDPHHERQRAYPPYWRERPMYEDDPEQPYPPRIQTFYSALFLASVVEGRELIDPMGGRLGRIRDLVINNEGRVENIILEARVLGDEVYVALPYEGPGFSYYGVVYDISIEELEALPKHSYPVSD